MTVEIEQRLAAIFREVLRRPDLQVDRAMSPVNFSDWTSMIHIKLFVTIERNFGIKFTTDEVVSTQSFGSLADLVGEKERLKR